MSSTTPVYNYANLGALAGPRFVVTVDTEEEFDWNKPFARSGFGTEHLKSIPRFQALCDQFGVMPCYMVDLPVVVDDYGADLLAGYAHTGRAEIGAHLHPWVNPPFDEELSARNSYPCNLPPSLERSKMSYLHNMIGQKMGVKPDAYRAGRYGAGQATPDILHDLGISIDTSVRPCFNYAGQHGPDYIRHPIHPYWIREGRLLELPLTNIFAGALRRAGPLVSGDGLSTRITRSILSRSNLLERIALTPEGTPLVTALRGVDLAIAANVPIINISLHSPSLGVGHTQYVRNTEQLEILYAWLGSVFQYLVDRGVRPSNMKEIMAASRITCFG